MAHWAHIWRAALIWKHPTAAHCVGDVGAQAIALRLIKHHAMGGGNIGHRCGRRTQEHELMLRSIYMLINVRRTYIRVQTAMNPVVSTNRRLQSPVPELLPF
jgi:hypothetical protein